METPPPPRPGSAAPIDITLGPILGVVPEYRLTANYLPQSPLDQKKVTNLCTPKMFHAPLLSLLSSLSLIILSPIQIGTGSPANVLHVHTSNLGKRSQSPILAGNTVPGTFEALFL